jgi:triphosphatase
LEPRFETDIHRTVRTLSLDGGSSVEVAIDEGRIVARDAEEPVHELELELKDGPIGPLYRLALELCAGLPLRIHVMQRCPCCGQARQWPVEQSE